MAAANGNRRRAVCFVLFRGLKGYMKVHDDFNISNKEVNSTVLDCKNGG